MPSKDIDKIPITVEVPKADVWLRNDYRDIVHRLGEVHMIRACEHQFDDDFVPMYDLQTIAEYQVKAEMMRELLMLARPYVEQDDSGLTRKGAEDFALLARIDAAHGIAHPAPAAPADPVGRYIGKDREYGYDLVELYEEVSLGEPLYAHPQPRIPARQIAELKRLADEYAEWSAAHAETFDSEYEGPYSRKESLAAEKAARAALHAALDALKC